MYVKKYSSLISFDYSLHFANPQAQQLHTLHQWLLGQTNRLEKSMWQSKWQALTKAPAICVPGKKNKFLKPFFQQKPDKMIVVVLFKYSVLTSRARSKKTIGRFEIILRTIVAAL